MIYIVLDLEATCWDSKGNSPNETIEIGALSINQEGKVLEEFSTFIKPTVHPILSDFCTELTTITQDMVDKAPLFPEAISKFQEWIKSFEGNDYYLCSWGFYDKGQFQRDCKLHNLETDWIEKHISIKHQYAKIKGLNRGIGMTKALQKERIELSGTHHRGIDDARNITKIFKRYLDRWDFS